MSVVELGFFPIAQCADGEVHLSQAHLQALGVKEGEPLLLQGEVPARARASSSLRNALACEGNDVMGELLRVETGQLVKVSQLREPLVPAAQVLLKLREGGRGEAARQWLGQQLRGRLVVREDTPVLLKLDGRLRRLLLSCQALREGQVGVVGRNTRILFHSEAGLQAPRLAAVEPQRATLMRLLRGTLRPPESSRRVPPPRGGVVAGPPGTGKSALCVACALEAEAPVVQAHAHYSASELRASFREAASCAPCVLIMEDVDVHEEVELSLLIDELPANVAILSSTSALSSLPSSLLTPSRLGITVDVAVPTQRERLEIMRVLLEDV